jgi:hypothetical protein
MACAINAWGIIINVKAVLIPSGCLPAGGMPGSC